MKRQKMVLMAALGLLVIGGVFAGGAKQQEPGGLTLEPGVLTVGMEIGYPPMEYFDVDGKTPIGFDVQLANTLAAKLGLKVKSYVTLSSRNRQFRQRILPFSSPSCKVDGIGVSARVTPRSYAR